MKYLASFIYLLGLVLSAEAQQLNLPNYDNKKKVRFGFTLGVTSNDFKISTSEQFRTIDSLKTISVIRFPGLTLGGIMCYKLNDKWELRTQPSLSLAQRNLEYTFTDETKNRKLRVESVYVEFPITIKYKTKRHRNVRFYTIAGFKYMYDFSSDINTTRSNSKPIVAIYPNTFHYEVGCGVDMYLPFFKFSPEIKLSQSIGNVMVKDDFIYTQSLKGLWSRIFMLSFHFE